MRGRKAGVQWPRTEIGRVGSLGFGGCGYLGLVETEPLAAFVSRESPLELTANLGVVAGRDASREEIETLGNALLQHVSAVTLFAGSRYEFSSHDAVTVAHEVTVRFPEYVLPSPSNAADYEAVVTQLLETLSLWARGCAGSPPPKGEDLAERIARASATER